MFTNIFAYTLTQLKNLLLTFTISDIIQVTLLVIFLLLFYKKFIKNTPSEKFIKGVLILVFVWIFSEILISLNLRIWGMFLKSIVALVSLSLIVIFQPELRKFLGFLGQVDFVSKMFESANNTVKSSNIDIVKEIIEAVKYLSKSHTGALIVFQGDLSHTYHDVGTILNADLSTELLLTIFHTNTPLHDGAVVIDGDKIISAGVLLPLTEDPKLSWKYGTRHRAAIGMSETSDAACLVVSEETGDVSVSLDGSLKKYEDLATLKVDLEKILGIKESDNDEVKHTIFRINNFIPIKDNKTKNDKD